MDPPKIGEAVRHTSVMDKNLCNTTPPPPPPFTYSFLILWLVENASQWIFTFLAIVVMDKN